MTIQASLPHFEDEMTIASSSSFVSSDGIFGKISRSRRFLRIHMEKERFHYFIIVLVITDLIAVFVDLVLAIISSPCLTEEEMESDKSKGFIPLQHPKCFLSQHALHQVETGESILFWFSVVLLILFLSEIGLAFYAFGWKRFKRPVFVIDALVVSASLFLELYFHVNNHAGRVAPGALVVLRLWKIVRAIHAIAHSIELKNHSIIHSVKKSRSEVEEDTLNLEMKFNKEKITWETLKPLVTGFSDEAMNEFIQKALERKRQETEKEAELKILVIEEKEEGKRKKKDATQD